MKGKFYAISSQKSFRNWSCLLGALAYTSRFVPIDLSAYQAVLLDLDGTVYHEDQPLPGAIQLIRRLHEQGRNYACLSNSTSSPLRVATRLGKMGVDVDLDRVYTAAAAAADYVLNHFHHEDNTRPRIYNLATGGVGDMLEGLVDWVQTEAEPCDAVIIGAPTNSQATPQRQRVALHLVLKGAAAVGICSDRVYPSERGLEFGSGALSWLLCFAAAVEPIFCGKPQKIFFEELCRRLNVEPNGCLLIGDNLESDIIGAKAVGMRTILTLTGVASRGDLAKLPADWQPDLVIEDLTELL
ncbi:MAG: HAD hydrolase-like protein [Tepidisphaeraceae bacterium]